RVARGIAAAHSESLARRDLAVARVDAEADLAAVLRRVGHVDVAFAFQAADIAIALGCQLFADVAFAEDRAGLSGRRALRRRGRPAHRTAVALREGGAGAESGDGQQDRKKLTHTEVS